MGEVHRATYCPEGGFVRTVAVKKIRADLAGEARFVEAFRREAYTAATLAHPNLVQVLDFGRFRGELMFVMEFVDGLSLDALLRARGGPLSASACAFVAHEIASALAYLHGRALVHCDVNPPNVLLSRAGEVKLADFGVMRACEPGAAGFGGKIAYAAPEQLSGDALDARSDLYALGVTLREALTGCRGAPLGDDMPAPLRAIADALVERDPARRPTSAEVCEQLHALAPAGKRALLEALRVV
jgi:serine/threonine-protein kinase